MIRRRNGHEAEAFDAALRAGDTSSDLVRTVELLRGHAADVQPADGFRTALRERLMAEAVDVLEPATVSASSSPRSATSGARTTTVSVPRSRTRRRVASVATGLIAAVGGVGLVTTSAQAMPGDALYPVKRGVENVELALQRSEVDRGEYRFDLAHERLTEAEALLEDRPGAASQVADLVDEFAVHAETGSTEYFQAFEADADTASIEAVNAFATSAAAELSALSGEAPEAASAALREAADVITDLAGQATRLCGSCSTTDLSALTGAVEQSVATAPAAPSTERPEKDARPTSATVEPAAATAPKPATTKAPQPAQSAPAPKPSPSRSTAPLEPLTKPLLDGLLGGEDTEGLVPGLLNGLLGGNSSR